MLALNKVHSESSDTNDIAVSNAVKLNHNTNITNDTNTNDTSINGNTTDTNTVTNGQNTNDTDFNDIIRIGCLIGVVFVIVMIILSYVLYHFVLRKNETIYSKMMTESESDSDDAITLADEEELKEEEDNVKATMFNGGDNSEDASAEVQEDAPVVIIEIQEEGTIVQEAATTYENDNDKRVRAPARAPVRPAKQIFKDCWQMLFGMVLLFLTSSAFFPAVFRKFRLENTTGLEDKIIVMVTIAMWAFVEPLSRFLAGKKRMQIPKRWFLPAVLARMAIFVTLFIVTLVVFRDCGSSEKEEKETGDVHIKETADVLRLPFYIPMIYIVLFSLSGGYLSSIGLVKGAEGISSTQEQVMVGTMMANADLTGQMAGALVSFVGSAFV